MNMKRLLARKMLVRVIGCAGVGVSVMCFAAEPGAGSFVLTPSDMDRVTAGTTASSDAWASAQGQAILTVAGSAAAVARSFYENEQASLAIYSASAGGFAGAAAYRGEAPSTGTGADAATALPVPTFVGGTIDTTIAGPNMQISNKADFKFGFAISY
jgi:hypothetical protein